MRVSVALPALSLPFDPERPGQTIVALDKAIFEAGITDDTFPLVDADVANGNAGFVLKGDVTDPLTDGAPGGDVDAVVNNVAAADAAG